MPDFRYCDGGQNLAYLRMLELKYLVIIFITIVSD
jgi:hypothetical protein